MAITVEPTRSDRANVVKSSDTGFRVSRNAPAGWWILLSVALGSVSWMGIFSYFFL